MLRKPAGVGDEEAVFLNDEARVIPHELAVRNPYGRPPACQYGPEEGVAEARGRHGGQRLVSGVEPIGSPVTVISVDPADVCPVKKQHALPFARDGWVW